MKVFNGLDMKWDADIETEAEAIAEAVANAGQMNKQQ